MKILLSGAMLASVLALSACSSFSKAENDEPTDEIAYKAYDIAKKFSNLKVQFYIP